MSKMFEVLGRLEEQSTTDVSPSVPKVNPPIPAPPFSLPTWSQRPTPNQLSRLPERPPMAPPTNPLIAIAFDGSMVLIALCLFLGVCFAMGSATVVSLTRNIPWLASLLIGLTLLYWLLSAILNRETPGAHFARKRAAQISGWPGVPRIDPRRQIDAPFGPPNRPQPANLLRRPLAEELALASKILTNEGVLDAYGSVSVRDERNPTHIFLSGTEVGEYDLNGKLLSNLPGEGHPERFLHCEIYRARPDVVAIVHSRASGTHSVWSEQRSADADLRDGGLPDSPACRFSKAAKSDKWAIRYSAPAPSGRRWPKRSVIRRPF